MHGKRCARRSVSLYSMVDGGSSMLVQLKPSTHNSTKYRLEQTESRLIQTPD